MKKPKGHRLRIGRHSGSNQIYLITTAIKNREKIFTRFEVGRLVVAALKHEEKRAKTLAFVVMPDHLHWLLQLNDSADLSRVVANMKSGSAYLINKCMSRSGPVWQRGFHDHAVRYDEDLKHLARYVIANPLRAGLVNNIADYPLWDAAWL